MYSLNLTLRTPVKNDWDIIAACQHIKAEKNVIEACSQGSNQSSIGLDNGLAPARQQTIIWTNDG